MAETRITGRLPQLDLEIRTGRDEAAGAEWMTLSLRAVPSFEAAARLLDPLFWWQAALTFNPWLTWFHPAALPPASPKLPASRADRLSSPKEQGNP